MQAEVQGLIDGHPVLVMATSTCPFCIEVREDCTKLSLGKLLLCGLKLRYCSLPRTHPTAVSYFVLEYFVFWETVSTSCHLMAMTANISSVYFLHAA